MTGYEFECLKLDIKDNGQHDPIMLYDGMILDGGNRYRACVELGVEPVTSQFEGDSITAYILSMNLHRRHLTPGQQAAIVASVQDWSKAHKPGGDGSNQHSGAKVQDCTLATSKDRAAISGTSVRTQKTADKVAKASPELAASVARGEISLPKAVEQIEGKKQKQEPVEQINEQEMLVDSLNTLVDDLYQQIDALKNELSSGGSADQKARFDELAAENRSLKANNKALTKSRDTLLNENAALKQQCKAQQAKLKKLEK